MSNWVGVGGGMVQGYARYSQAMAEKQELEYNAAVARNQALMARYSTEIAVQQHKKAIFDIIGESRAAIAASGLQESGSPLEILLETAREGEHEMRLIEYEGRLRALGLRDEADMLENRAKTAMTIGRAAAVGTALSSAGSTQYSYSGSSRSTQEGGGYQHHRADEKH